MRCDLQIFSGCVCPLEQLHAQSPFLFPIVFSINNILCVSDFCERERERDACDVIDITLKSRVIMHMITSTARRPNASTRSDSEPVERSNFEVHDIVKTRSLALERSIEQQGRVIDERRWGSGSFAFAGQTAVDHPAAFRCHASSKKNRPS